MKIMRILAPLQKLILPLLLLVVWIGIGDMFPPAVFPSFSSTIETLQQLLENGEMQLAWLSSMQRIMTATIISVCISLPLGLLVRSFVMARRLITPLTDLIRFVPVTVFYPLLIVWAGIDELMKISFLFVATFFVFFPSVVLTLDSVDTGLIEKALTRGTNKWKMIWHVYLPAALPSLSLSFLAMISVGFTYMIIAETMNARYGLGHLMLIGGAKGRMAIVFAAILVTVITGVIIDVVGRFIIKKVFKWYFAQRKGV